MAGSGQSTDQSAVNATSSMTGFASGQGAAEGWTWTVDIRSVNGRGLDLRFRLPDWIDGLEPELRKQLQGRLQRGNLNVGIRVQRDESIAGLRLNVDTLERALTVLIEIGAAAHSHGIELRQMSAPEIAAVRGVLETSDAASSDTTALRSAILETAGQCIEDFIADRAREGQAIAGIISQQIDRVETLVEEARTAAGDRDAAARQSMERAISRLLDATEVPDELRLIQELALIAVKNDVTEEMDRLGAHIVAARDMLAQSGAIGRKFDFLMQEFNREANTLCSKSQSAALTAIGLDLKSVIDQMREQVQNIE